MVDNTFVDSLKLHSDNSNSKMKSNNVKLAVCIYLLMFFSNDTYIFGTNSINFFNTLPRYIMLGLCLLFALKLSNHNVLLKFKSNLLLYLFLSIPFIISCIIHSESTTRIAVKLICITCAMLMTSNVPFYDYSEAFRKAMVFVSICSIIITIIAYLSPSLIRILPVMTNSAGMKIYTCLFAGIDERMLGQAAIRTNGIFWEPGVFQMYLNLAILFELYCEKAKNTKRIIVYILALVLTFSTTGYICLFWIVTSYLLFYVDSGTRKSIVNFLLLLLLLIIAGVLFILFEDSITTGVVFGKLFDPTHGSTNVRLASVITNIEIFVDNPIWGIGMEAIPQEFIYRTLASKLIYGYTSQNTNTLLYQFAAHGILFGSAFTIGTYRFGKKLSDSKIVIFIIFIAIVLLYIGENLMVSMLPYIIIFYGCTNKEKMRSN